MVHALEEIWRVLVSDGVLIDLRPLAANWPVEVVSRRERQRAGHVTDSEAALKDDAAANQAVEDAAQRGWCRREKEQTFPFNYYWDSPEQMRQFMEEEWEDFASLEEDLWKRIRSLWAVADADARVRIQVNMLITRWRRSA
jgi:hypothetical protein